ncbi:uncharacterized protein LOC117602396 isoform X1 [Osmia lignaria lignaria]|uniref:uncharacterized protein LOC117602396 isoform X1 n=1 Tax=Osmia lignaria lignaria TaxID=1437193 RepID=UPI00402B2861
MSSYTSSTVSLAFLFTIAISWIAIASVQVGANVLQRDLYGAANGQFLAGYPDDHGEATKEKSAQLEQGSSRFGNANDIGGRQMTGDDAPRVKIPPTLSKSRLFRDEEVDRLLRNLDQIGGGNLLRRRGLEIAYEPRWLTPRRNLDQIGGGNLLRSVDERFARNLDQIGGGNLVRSVLDDRRRNLDHIGGGNLVRDLSEIAGELEARAVESRSGKGDS